MKKLYLLSFVLLFLFVPLANAQQLNIKNLPTPRIEKGMIPGSQGISWDEYNRNQPPNVPNQAKMPNFLGQVQNYSVILRGNGEAIVTGKITFSNNFDNALNDFSLEGPLLKPVNDLMVYQQVRQGNCLSYETQDQPYRVSPECGQFTTLEQCDAAGANYNINNCAWYACVNQCLNRGTPTETVCPTSVCSQYENPDYFTENYFSGTQYHKLNSDQRGNKIKIKLYKPIPPQSSGSLIFYYVLENTARKNLFGAYDFQFETLKVDDKIKNVTVGISTDPDYFLKDAKGKIDYRTQETFPAIASKNPDLRTGAASPQMDSYYNQIGFGQITKTATNLQANESYKIKGSYADAQWKLYAGETIRNIFLFILFATVFIVIIRLVIRSIFRGLSGITAASGKKTSVKENTHPLILSVCLSFASSIIIIITILVFIFLNSSSIFYSFSPYGVSNLLQPIMMLTVTVILLCIDILALLLPTLFMWKKAGSTWGVVTFLLNIMWFFFYLISAFLVIFIFSMRSVQQISPPYPVMPPIAPMMKNF